MSFAVRNSASTCVLVGDVDVDVRRDARCRRARRRGRAPPLVVDVADDDLRALGSTKRRTVASPMPEQPPVTTATRPSMRPATRVPPSGARGLDELDRRWGAVDDRQVRDEDVLLLGERVRRVRAELPAEAGLLVAAERRPVADARVAVHAEVARSATPRETRSAAAEVRGEDRARQPVVGVVGQGDRLAPRRRTAITATSGPNTSSRQTGSATSRDSTTIAGSQKPSPSGRRALEGDRGVPST